MSVQLLSMEMALYSSRQPSPLTITRFAFASEPPAPMVCCFLPRVGLSTCYWSFMQVACRLVHLWLQHMGMCASMQYTQIFMKDHMHTNKKTCHTWTTLSNFSISVDSDSVSTQLHRRASLCDVCSVNSIQAFVTIETRRL